MYTKDKAHRITLRLNETQFLFVKDNADMLDVSPSEFLRMVVNATMAMSKATDQDKAAQAVVDEVIKTAKEGFGRENDKANIDDKL